MCVYTHLRAGKQRQSYLCEIEDMRVRDREESIDGAAEGVDLLVRVSHKDLPTGLRQNDVHDGCNPEGQVSALM